MFVTCSKCDRQYWERDGHVCPPVYEVWDKDYSDEPKEIYAFDHQEAAENYLARYDAEYEWPDQIEVLVRKRNEKNWIMYSVFAEQTREYTARLTTTA